MYYVLENTGDSIAVPQIVFAKLTAPSANDERFRVALYMLATGSADILTVSSALKIKPENAAKALEYWEGAGLLEAKTNTPSATTELEPRSRTRLTTADVAEIAQADSMLGKVIDEIQHILGGVVSQADINIFVTLYSQDKFEADLILLATAHCVSLQKISAKYIEKVLFSWRRAGITTCEQADAYLQTLAKREQREHKIAKMVGLDAKSFTLSERKHIAEWFEVYAYGKEMIQAARLSAGEKGNNIRYISGILKNWYKKGYRTPNQVAQSENISNIRVQGPEETIAPEENILANMARGRRRAKQ